MSVSKGELQARNWAREVLVLRTKKKGPATLGKGRGFAKTVSQDGTQGPGLKRKKRRSDRSKEKFERALGRKKCTRLSSGKRGRKEKSSLQAIGSIKAREKTIALRCRGLRPKKNVRLP